MLTSLAFLPSLAAALLSSSIQLQGDIGRPWPALPLPAGTSIAVDVEIGRSGFLYLATDEGAFVRSPYGESESWRVVEGPSSEEGPAHAVEDLAVLDGLADEALCVVHGDELRLVSWAHPDEQDHPWDVFRLTFSEESLPAPAGIAFERVHGLGEGADGRVRGWIEAKSGELSALMVDDDSWEVNAEWLVPASGAGWSVVHQPEAEGALAWARGGEHLYWLDDSGSTARLADLEAVSGKAAAKGAAEIRSVQLDVEREVVFVGTSRGLLVGDWSSGNLEVPIELIRVESLKESSVVALGTTAGRLRVTVADPARFGLASAVVLEGSLRSALADVTSLAAAEFIPTADGGPANVAAAFSLADDLLLVFAEDGVWEWAPGRWERVPGIDAGGAAIGVKAVLTHPAAPPVFLDRPGRRVLYRSPSPPSGWHVHASVQSEPIERLLPDPSGRGVWSYAAGSWCFETPRGSLRGAGSNGADSTGDDARLLVKEWVLELPGAVSWLDTDMYLSSSEQHLPESALGGLLAPAGDHFVHLDAGVVTEVPWSLPAGAVLRDLMPATELGSTGWLGIYEDGESTRVALVDLTLDEEGSLQMQVLEVPVTVASDALFYDSTGEVWCGAATRSEDGSTAQWSCVPVRTFFEPETNARPLGALPVGERPRALWLAPDEPMSTVDDLLFTDHGVLPIRRADPTLLGQRKGPRRWTELFASTQTDGAQRRFRGLRLPAQIFASWTFDRRLLVLTEMASAGEAPRADRAFVLRVEEPAKPLVSAEVELGIEADDLIVPLWFGNPYGDVDTLLLPRDESRGRPSATYVTRTTLSVSESTSFEQNVDPLEVWVSAARVVGESYGSEPDDVVVAGTDGALIALRTAETETMLETTHVPVEVTLLRGDEGKDGEVARRVPDSRLSDVIPSEFTGLRLRVEPAQWAWWSDTPGLAYMTLNEERRAFDVTGTATVPLGHDESYDIGVGNDSLSTGEPTGLTTWTAKTAPAPPPPAAREVVAITLAALAAALAVILGVVRPLRRATLAMLRRRHWSPVAPTPDLEVSWSAALNAGEHAWRSRAFHESTWRDGDGENSWRTVVLETRVPDGGGHPSTALVEFPEGRASGVWDSPSILRDAAGELRGIVGFQPSVTRPPQRPRLRKVLSAVVITDAPGEGAARTWRDTIRRSGLRAKLPVEMGAETNVSTALGEALAADDMVVLLGEPGALPQGLGGSLRKRDVRARCLIMQGHEEAPSDEARRWILALAELGIHVLWLPSVAGLDDFRPEFLSAFLHGGWSGGATLAASIESGLSRIDAAAAPDFERALLLVGNPELRFAPIRRHFAFLSHSSKDESQVRWLRGRLRGLIPLPTHRRRICVDQDSFSAGPLRRTVADNLAGSDWLLVCNSPECAASVWVEREVRQFLRDRPGDRLRFCDLVPTESVDAAFLAKVRSWSGEEELIRPNVSGYPNAKARAAVEVLRRELQR